jgi:putative chitobiose transport system permease protein
MIRAIVKWTIIGTASAVSVFPFLWLLSTSLKGSEEIFAFPPSFIPETFVWENYAGVWNAIPFALYLFNSIVVAALSVGLNVFLASLAGFSLARFSFKYKNLVFFTVLASMMVPKEVIIIPLFTTILEMQLSDSLIGVVLPFAVEGMGIFLMRQAFLSIPKEIEEAGIMDGASPIRLWWNVMLPMTKPALATLAIFTFIGSWGDFLWPLIVLKSPEHFTLQVGLSYMLGTFVDNYRYVAAGSVLAVIPVVIVFIFMQRHFERGIFAGSEK